MVYGKNGKNKIVVVVGKKTVFTKIEGEGKCGRLDCWMMWTVRITESPGWRRNAEGIKAWEGIVRAAKACNRL